MELFDHRKNVQKKLKKTCKELVVYLNQGAINIYSKHILKEAKVQYIRRDFEASVINIAKAYTLGSSHSLNSMSVLINKNRTGSLNLRQTKENTLLSFDAFKVIRNEKYNLMSNIGDRFFYGFKIEGKDYEKYSNSYKMYEASWKLSENFYSLYSMGKSTHQILSILIFFQVTWRNMDLEWT